MSLDPKLFEPDAEVPVNAETTTALFEEVKRLRAWHDQRNSYREHPASDLTEWRAYEAMPIQIHSQACIVVTVFKKDSHHFHDLWLHDHPDISRAHWEMYQRAAEQFRQQLQGHDCIAFWQALKAEAEKGIEAWKHAKGEAVVDWEKECGHLRSQLLEVDKALESFGLKDATIDHSDQDGTPRTDKLTRAGNILLHLKRSDQ